MYDASAITALVARVGWAEPSPLPNGASTQIITLDAATTHTDSERTFRNFHALVTAENVMMTMAIPNITLTQNPDNTALNAYLQDLMKEGARKVLHRLFVANTGAKDVWGKPLDILGTDWTATISDKLALFDEAYGRQVAYDTLTMMLASIRLNNVEKIIGQKGDLIAVRNGVVRDNKVISPGIAQELEDAYAALSSLLFPAYHKKPIVRFVSM